MTSQNVPTLALFDLGAHMKALRTQRAQLATERDEAASQYVEMVSEIYAAGDLRGVLDAMRGLEIVYGPGWTNFIKDAGLPEKKQVESALLGTCNDGDGMWCGTFPIQPDDFRPTGKTWVVYRLLKGDELLYIGSTGSFLSRIKAHARDKDFDRWQAAKCATEGECRRLEKILINNYRPPLNRMIPRVLAEV